jgi:hypothetical protein
MSNEDYRKLQMETEAIIHEKGYTIEVVHPSSTDYIFYSKVKNTTDDTASHVEVYTGEEDIKTKRTRADNTQSLPTFAITSVETSINHRGKSLALLLISYAICYLKQIHSNTRYVLLDDCSDNSHKIEQNLYHKLGFVPRDHTALSMYDSTELKLCGPEKQLLINKGFLQKARDVNSLEQRRNLSHKSHKSHKSHLITKARRSLKSAALEQLKKEYILNYPEKGKGRKSRKRNNSTRMLKKHKKHKKQIPTTRKRNKIRTSTRRHY